MPTVAEKVAAKKASNPPLTRPASPAKKPTAKAREEEHVLHFEFEKSTKGTHRFVEVAEDGSELDRADTYVGTLYVQKAAIGEDAPSKLTVTIAVTK